MLVHEAARRDSGDDWMRTPERTNDAHTVLYNEECPWDTATVIHKDISDEVTDIITTSGRHWLNVTCTYTNERYTIGNCHMPTS